jgi:hypothetical protein
MQPRGSPRPIGHHFAWYGERRASVAGSVFDSHCHGVFHSPVRVISGLSHQAVSQRSSGDAYRPTPAAVCSTAARFPRPEAQRPPTFRPVVSSMTRPHSGLWQQLPAEAASAEEDAMSPAPPSPGPNSF